MRQFKLPELKNQEISLSFIPLFSAQIPYYSPLNLRQNIELWLQENLEHVQAPRLVRALSSDARVDSGVRAQASLLLASWMRIVSPAPGAAQARVSEFSVYFSFITNILEYFKSILN